MVAERKNVRTCPACSKPTKLVGMRGERITFYCTSCGAVLIVPKRREQNEQEKEK